MLTPIEDTPHIRKLLFFSLEIDSTSNQSITFFGYDFFTFVDGIVVEIFIVSESSYFTQFQQSIAKIGDIKKDKHEQNNGEIIVERGTE